MHAVYLVVFVLGVIAGNIIQEMMISEINDEGSSRIGPVARGFWRYPDVARLHRRVCPASQLRNFYNYVASIQVLVIVLVVIEIVRNNIGS
jgi:hypothetical protein